MTTILKRSKTMIPRWSTELSKTGSCETSHVACIIGSFYVGKWARKAIILSPDWDVPFQKPLRAWMSGNLDFCCGTAVFVWVTEEWEVRSLSYANFSTCSHLKKNSTEIIS